MSLKAPIRFSPTLELIRKTAAWDRTDTPLLLSGGMASFQGYNETETEDTQGSYT